MFYEPDVCNVALMHTTSPYPLYRIQRCVGLCCTARKEEISHRMLFPVTSLDVRKGLSPYGRA